jgi:hypothetical protein
MFTYDESTEKLELEKVETPHGCAAYIVAPNV